MASPSPSLQVGSRVFIHGLVSKEGQGLNLKAGRVVAPEEDGRFGVLIQQGSSPSSPKRLKRTNLLCSDRMEDRQLFMQLLTLRHLRLLVPALKQLLKEDLGLILLVSSFVSEPPVCLYQFGGFMQRVWMENWSFMRGAPKPLAKQKAPRLDAACCDLALGRVLFAGGCSKHPALCGPDDFFDSAELYDCLTDTWEELPSMATRRHGATACQLDGKVYVMGGMYVDDRPVPMEEKFCEVIDQAVGVWTPLPLSAYRHLRMDEDILDNSAFFGAAAVNGRIVARMGHVTLAYNPSLPEDGWRAVVADAEEVKVGSSSCCAVWQNALIVASGRPTAFARKVAAFCFHKPASDPLWYHGAWRQLPELQHARVGGAMAVMNDKMYITGGVCEMTGEFQDTAECLEDLGGTNGWKSVPWFKMPRALHAHDTFALPYLQ